MIKKAVIIFDVFKTLIDIKTDEEDSIVYDFLSNWLSYSGITITANDFYESFRRNVKLLYDLNTNEHPDVDLSEVFWQLYSDTPIPSYIDKKSLISETAILFRILTTKSLSIYPETHKILNELYSLPNIRLCIASNTQRLFTIPELRKFNLEKYFEYIVFSSDVKAGKPNPKIFKAVLVGMGVKSSEAIYVGDNLFDDIGGAQKVGMRTIWIDRGGDYKYPSDFIKPIPDAIVLGDEIGRLPEVIYALLYS